MNTIDKIKMENGFNGLEGLYFILNIFDNQSSTKKGTSFRR